MIDINVFWHNAETDKRLTEIDRKLDKIMANQADLDAAIADLGADITTQTGVIDAAVQSIINAIAAAGAPIDLSAEVASLQAAKTALDAVAAQLPTTPTPP